jgi:hypothetical protein
MQENYFIIFYYYSLWRIKESARKYKIFKNKRYNGTAKQVEVISIDASTANPALVISKVAAAYPFLFPFPSLSFSFAPILFSFYLSLC